MFRFKLAICLTRANDDVIGNLNHSLQNTVLRRAQALVVVIVEEYINVGTLLPVCRWRIDGFLNIGAIEVGCESWWNVVAALLSQHATSYF